MLLTCVPELVPTPVPVPVELWVGLLGVPPVEDAVGVELGVNVTPFILASVAMASPILIQSNYQKSASSLPIVEYQGMRLPTRMKFGFFWYRPTQRFA